MPDTRIPCRYSVSCCSSFSKAASFPKSRRTGSSIVLCCFPSWGVIQCFFIEFQVFDIRKDWHRIAPMSALCPFNIQLSCRFTQRCVRESAEKSGQQRNQCGANEGDTAACHQLLHALGLRAGVVIAIPFHQVYGTPDAEACSKCDYECLKYVYCAVKKCHMFFLRILKYFVFIVFRHKKRPVPDPSDIGPMPCCCYI